MSPSGKTAFVIAGGGSLGAVQVGMLKALQAAGLQADLVAGVSVGSLNAYCYACDPTAAGIAALERIWLGIRRTDVFPAPGFRGLWRILRGTDHLLESTRLAELLDAHLPARDFESTRLPCLVVANDLLSGTAVTLSRGSILPALLASTAIPALFPPVVIDGRLLNDGGFAYQAPFEAVIASGATRLYVLPTGYSCARQRPPRSAVGHAVNALNQLCISKLIGAIQHYAREREVHVVPPLCPLDVSPLDFSRTAELIQRAEVQTRDWLQHGTEMEDGLPHQLAPHAH
jgi:NTE family protein